MSIPLRALIVEDSEDDALLIARELRRSGYDLVFQRVDTAAAMRAALLDQAWDVIIADYAMPHFSGIAALDLLRNSGLDVPFIIVSGTIGEDIAVGAMRAGAHDYVLKGNLVRLGPAVRRELQESRERHARRRAERLQRESEARFRRMADSIQDGLTIVERDQVIYANRRACEIVGYSEQEYRSMTFLDFAAPEEVDRLRQVSSGIDDVRAGSLEVEFWVICKDGTRRCVQCRYSPSREGNQIVGHYVVTTDVTERKLAEREVEERSRYLARVLAAAPDAIVTLDAEHRIVEWNAGAARLFGYSYQEAIGQDIDHLITRPEAREAAVAYTQVVIAGEEVPPTEVVRYRKDGTPVHAIMAGSPILVGEALIGVVAVYTDIAVRKRAERLLHALNEAALALEQALTPQEVFDAIGAEFKKLGFAYTIFLIDESRNRLIPASFSFAPQAVQAAEKLSGVKAEQFSIAVDDVDLLRQVVREGKTLLVDGSKSLRQVFPASLQRFAPQIVRILQIPRLIDAPLSVEDQVIGMLSVQSEDLTADDLPAITAFAHQLSAAWRKAKLMQDLEMSLEELKRTQAQFLQAQKMEAIGRLAGGVAHDFNNTLTIIHLSTQLLKRQLRLEDPLWEYVQQIEEAGLRASKLTKQLLSFSRREVIEPQVVDLSQLVADLGLMLKRIIGEDIELVTHLAGNLWPVCLDPTQIDQALVNLVVNARDAMPHGGRLTIETVNVLLDEAYTDQHVDLQPGEYVRLMVSDTGVGMGPEVMEHIFEPFFTTKEREHGTGLGLSTVFGIVKQNEGHITVESRTGQGTTFTIYLPRSQAAQSPPPSTARPVKAMPGTETILVVEDDADVRSLAVDILQGHGYHVLDAGSGLQALEISRGYDGDIHLLLTDVVMPQMNGTELARQLQLQRPETRVLYMSGHSDETIALHGGGSRGVNLLTKPFSVDALAAKTREVLRAPA